MADNEALPEDEPQFVDFSFPNFYANNVNIASTFMDFSFMFLERLDMKNQTIKARIVMTPTHAKLMANLLNGQIEKWEKRWGQIRLLPLEPPPTASSSEPEQQP